jgi:hypothetical protein
MAAELALLLLEDPSSLPEMDDAEGVRERLSRGAVEPIRMPGRSMLYSDGSDSEGFRRRPDEDKPLRKMRAGTPGCELFLLWDLESSPSLSIESAYARPPYSDSESIGEMGRLTSFIGREDVLLDVVER